MGPLITLIWFMIQCESFFVIMFDADMLLDYDTSLCLIWILLLLIWFAFRYGLLSIWVAELIWVLISIWVFDFRYESCFQYGSLMFMLPIFIMTQIGRDELHTFILKKVHKCSTKCHWFKFWLQLSFSVFVQQKNILHLHKFCICIHNLKIRIPHKSWD